MGCTAIAIFGSLFVMLCTQTEMTLLPLRPAIDKTKCKIRLSCIKSILSHTVACVEFDGFLALSFIRNAWNTPPNGSTLQRTGEVPENEPRSFENSDGKL